MIDKNIELEIQKRLTNIEKEHNVRVLYAIESGSRAWGFASVNSDYDVRFVYAHPRDWYLCVEPQRDVIEYPIVDDFDLSGWDIRKALQLFRKSNPSLMEWLQSPIVYRCDGQFAPKLRTLLTEQYSCIRGLHHYLSMAKTNYRGYLKTDEVPLKKYFYVLRPLLAARWIERYQSVPPIEFERLLQMLDNDNAVNTAIMDLIAQKKLALEKQIIPAVTVLNDFIGKELDRLELKNTEATPGVSTDALDIIFRKALVG